MLIVISYQHILEKIKQHVYYAKPQLGLKKIQVELFVLDANLFI